MGDLWNIGGGGDYPTPKNLYHEGLHPVQPAFKRRARNTRNPLAPSASSDTSGMPLDLCSSTIGAILA